MFYQNGETERKLATWPKMHKSLNNFFIVQILSSRDKSRIHLSVGMLDLVVWGSK
jgi:hypothetical protein